jgi:hypothetical protein
VFQEATTTSCLVAVVLINSALFVAAL